MKLSKAVTAVRDKIHDSDRKTWSDAEITRWIDHHSRNLFRHKVNADDSYGGVTFAIRASDDNRVRKVRPDTYAYYLPSWAYRIYAVRIADTSTRGVLVDFRANGSTLAKGWRFLNDRAIEVTGWGAAQDLELIVAKLPPPLHAGICPQGSNDASEILLDPQPVDVDGNAFDFEHEDGAYIGSEFQFTTLGSTSRELRDQVVFATAQEHFYSNTRVDRIQRMTVMPEIGGKPVSGDVYEMHVPVDEMHYEFLSALVAQSLFQKTRNVDGIAALQTVLRSGKNTFIDSLRPRQQQQPMMLGGSDGAGSYHPDRDDGWGEW